MRFYLGEPGPADIENITYVMYMNEAEGFDDWVDTRESKLNACVRDFCRHFRMGYNINEEDTQELILNRHDLSLSELSNKEKRYLAEKTKKELYK